MGCAADISKFHNQVYLEELGVKSAGCIATSALHMSADAFAEVYPGESKELRT